MPATPARGTAGVLKGAAVALGTAAAVLLIYVPWRVLSFLFGPKSRLSEPRDPLSPISEDELEVEGQALATEVRQRGWARRAIKVAVVLLLITLLPPLGLTEPQPAFAAYDTLELAPATATNPVDTTHTVIATATTSGTFAGDVTFTFTAAGTGDETPGGAVEVVAGAALSVVTATFDFKSTVAGTSLITVTGDDGSEVKTATASKDWTPGALDHYFVTTDPTPEAFVAECFDINVQAQDAFDNDIPTDASKADLEFSIPIADFDLFDDAACTTPAIDDDVQLAAGSGTKYAEVYVVSTVFITATQVVPAGSAEGSTSIDIVPTSTMTLLPDSDNNPVGADHSVVATVSNLQTDLPVSDVVVDFEAAGTGDETPGTDSGSTDASGKATYTFTSSVDGTSLITATAVVAGVTHVVTATKTWNPPATITLTPSNATNTVGQLHTVTVTVTDLFGNPVPNTTITFEADGTPAPGESPPTEVVFTDAAGVATYTFSSTKSGTSLITATTYNGLTATATKVWEPDVPFRVELTPKLATNTVGDPHVVTATVFDQYDNITDTGPTDVVFAVSGTGGESPGIEIGGTTGGVATFTFTSTQTGFSDIVVLVRDGDGFLRDEATKNWTNRVPDHIEFTENSQFDVNIVGEAHTVTVVVTDEFGNAVPGTTVTFTASGTGGEDPLSPTVTLTDSNGQAVFTFTSTKTSLGSYTSMISADAGGGVTTGGINGFGEDATKLWGPGEPGSVVVDPASDTNEVSDTHTVTATVYDEFGNVVSFGGFECFTFGIFCGALVTFEFSGTGGESPVTDTEGTDSDGEAMSSFTSIVTGQSLITATANGAFGTATKNWTPGPADHVELTPEIDKNEVGTTHVVTATIYDEFGNVVDTTHSVEFNVSGTGFESPSFSLVSSTAGVASFAFSSTATGTSKIEVRADAGGGTLISDTATKIWHLAASVFTLTPTGVTNVVGDTHIVTATLTDAEGVGIPNVPVTFTAAGTGFESPSGDVITTDFDGNAVFSFSSTKTGSSVITATTNGFTATATKDWIAGVAVNVMLTPDDATNVVGETHTVTGMVTDEFGNPVSTEVLFCFVGSCFGAASGSSTGAEDPNQGVGFSDSEGKATFSFTSTRTGTSLVWFFASDGSEECIDAPGPDECPQTTATKTWLPGAPDSVTLVPLNATNVVGTTHHVTATVLDSYGNAVLDGTTVTFTASGTGAESPSMTVATTTGGEAYFWFTSTITGTSLINALIEGGSASAALTNGGFETGDFTGWSVVIPGGEAFAAVTTSHSADFDTYLPVEGSYFALLGANGEDSNTIVSQTVSLSAGETVGGYAAFDCREEGSEAFTFPDDAAVQILTDTVIATPWFESCPGVGSLGDGPWTPWSFTASESGTYEIRYRVANRGDDAVESYALFDADLGVTGQASKTWVEDRAVALEIDPVAATNIVGEDHKLTATVVDEFGNRVFEPFRFAWEAGGTGAEDPNSAGPRLKTDGQDMFTFTSTQAGTSIITVSVITSDETIYATATKIWHHDGADSVEVTPASATNVVGDTHIVTATVTDQYGNPVGPGHDATITVSGPVSFTFMDTDTTDDDGVAVFGFTQTKTGQSLITVTASSDGTDDGGVGEASGFATKDWIAGPPATITLTPISDTNPLRTEHRIVGSVFDTYGNPVNNGVTVGYTAAGTGAESPSSRTDTTTNGDTDFPFTSNRTGVSIITAVIGANGIFATATKTWICPPTSLPDFAPYPGFTKGIFVASGDVDGDGCDDVITGADAGGGPHVKVFRGDSGVLLASFMAYETSFRGGVRVGAGDVDGDGKAEIITGPGSGRAGQVRVFDVDSPAVLKSTFSPYAGWSGGVYVAGGDTNGDSFDDIITGADAGGGPHVKVFSGKTGATLESFFAYVSSFRGGVRVGAGDINNDGDDEVITGPGRGGGPHVKVFNRTTSLGVLTEFMAYTQPRLHVGGIFVAGGDVVPGNPGDEIITGADSGIPGVSGGGPHVKVWNKAKTVIQDFMAFESSYRGGIRVASADTDTDGNGEVLTGRGRGGLSTVNLRE